MAWTLCGGVFLLAGVAVLTGFGDPATPNHTRPDGTRNDHYVTNRAPLAPEAYIPLPLGAVKPRGWLRTQLQTMADGMAGHLDEIYPNVGPSNAWRGGDGDAWERGPYWLDGLVPLAYLLEDERLIEKTKPWIEWTLASQRADGFFGPADDQESTDRAGFQTGNKADWWPRMVMLKVLQQHYEATGDERVIDFMTDYFRYQQQALPELPLDNWTHWAKTRGGENQASIYWLYNRTGDEFLLDLAQLVFDQTRDWTGRFTEDHAAWHGVNTAMGLKQPAVQYMGTKERKYLEAVDAGFAYLMKEHGQVQGMFSGDELLHGTDPAHGTELCTVVELMYSLEMLAALTGRVDYLDHLEKVAYNALPAQVTPDYTARQYFQQPNQIRISREADKERPFITNHDGATICYGLLTGYPCCTANMHQGWPKLVAHQWYATPGNGLAALVYGPSEVTATVGEGTEVRIVEETNYPFEEQVRFRVEPAAPVAFPLHLRVPAWAGGAEVRVNGELWSRPEAGTMAVVARPWQAGDVVELTLPMQVRVSRWHERSAGVERGPLVYALHVDGRWDQVDEEHGVPTWEVHPTADWNYGIILNHRDLASSFRVERGEMSNQPWRAEAAPIRLVVQGRKIPTWKEYNGSTGPLPFSDARTQEPAEELVLLPYGSTVLRVAEIPVVNAP